MTDASNHEVDRRQAKEWADRGHARWKQGNHFEAISCFSRALSADPDDAWTLMRRGAARAAIGDIAGSTADLARAMAMTTGDAAKAERRWSAAQLGEGIRAFSQDAAIAPGASAGEVEAALSALGTAIEAFTAAISANPEDAWALAHRGATSMLAYWIGARAGVDRDRVERYAASAQSDLEAALRLKPSYHWAMVIEGTLLTIIASYASNPAEQQSLFARTAALVEEAGRLSEDFAALPPLAELALYRGELDRVVELGSTQIARDPGDAVSRYCMAWALKRMTSAEEAGDRTVGAARREAADAFVDQTRRSILAKRSRLSAMLGGLAMLEGDYDTAAKMLTEVLEYPDLHTMAFLRCEPAWDPIRDRAAGAVDPRMGAVVDAYARLFPGESRETLPR